MRWDKAWHATKPRYVIQVAKKGQQKVGNGWNQAQEKEAGWVKDCACVILVLCFAGDSSKMKGFIDDAVEAGGSGWKPYGYFG